MKLSAPSYRFSSEGEIPSLALVPPGGDKGHFVRLFLRSPVMDRAGGDPALSREFISGDFPVTSSLTAPRQVHGTEIVTASKNTSLPQRPSADGVLLEESGIEGSLRFADCFPVVLGSNFPAPWMALLHSGYKGVVKNIAGQTCSDLFRSRGAIPSKTWAWIGPGISVSHYFRKKGETWTEKGKSSFSPDNMQESKDAIFFDLGAQIRTQLLEAGVQDEMICTIPLCTFRDYDVCYSYRRGDRENRMFLLGCIK